MTKSPFSVALTGGIASGKSAAAARFATLGAGVIDADVVARELVAPGTPALAEIVATFGADVLDAKGALDRRALRERVFADRATRSRLEAILHPRVRAALRESAAAIDAPYALLVIPLLVESGHYDWVDRVVVVDALRAQQKARLMARDGIAAALADSMLDAQANRERRLAIADDVIVNDGVREDLDHAVDALHARYMAMAHLHGR